jgi:hypothetical protein
VARWIYRKKKALLAERERAAKEWLSANPDLAQRLQAETAKRVPWKTFWLDIEDRSDIDVPPEVKSWLQKCAGWRSNSQG